MSNTRVIVLENNFDAVRKSISSETLMKAAKAGGRVIQVNAQINTNNVFSSKSTAGAGLGGSIKVLPSKSTPTSAWVDVGPTVIYGRIQELGGIILPVRAKMLSWVEDAVRIFAKRVQIPARPYLRPAVDEHEKEIVQAVGYQIKKGIEAVT